MSESKDTPKDKLKAERLKLWLDAEKKLTNGFDPETLRTAGLLSVERRAWKAALLRLEEAVTWGVRDLQTLDALGEAAYQTKTPHILIPLQNFYADPMVAVHMARAFLMMGQIEDCKKYLALSRDTLLKEAITAMTRFEKDIESVIQVMTTPLKSPFENLNLLEYWQALAPVADVAGRLDLVHQAERKLSAYAYERPVFHYNQALRLLTRGELSAGWKLYDWRLVPGSGCEHPTACADIAMWEGESLEQKNILIILENGFGDQIFSLRYIQALLNDGVQVNIATKPEIFALAKSSFPACAVHLAKDVYRPEYWKEKSKPDYWGYAFSVPARSKHFGFIGTKGFLKADDLLVAKCAADIKKVNPNSLPVVGLTWHGDMQNGPMRSRAYTVTEFLEQSEVLKTPCVIVCLQKDVTPEELSVLTTKAAAHQCILINTADSLVDFSITAAWMKNCEHLISCDTAAAHLAGGLGLESTVLIRNKAIWYWINEQDQASQRYYSKWYNSVEVKFRLNPKLSYMFEIRP